MTYSLIEQEAINLCICLEAVADISNHALFKVVDVASIPSQTESHFHSYIHKELFLIRVLDFVKEKTDLNLTGVKGSCIDTLKNVCHTRCFDISNSICHLENSVQELDAWLSHRKLISLWLPTLDLNAEVEVSRLDFLKISGNHSKHNLSRLTAVSKDITKLLEGHGYSVPIEQIPLALDDFREHLQENYFSYYGTWLSELMNNIRWGIQNYLQPFYNQAYIRVESDSYMYRYEYPSEIKNDIPKQWYWRLMNNIRSRPHHKKFSGAYYLKEESSLEDDF